LWDLVALHFVPTISCAIKSLSRPSDDSLRQLLMRRESRKNLCRVSFYAVQVQKSCSGQMLRY